MKDVELKELSDEYVIMRIKSGIPSEFSHIVLRYQENIYALIMRQVGDENISQELTQESFIKAYKGISKFRGDSKVLTWLTRIALNVTNSYFDSRRYKEAKQNIVFDPILHESTLSDPKEEYPEELIQALQKFLTTLKAHHREAVVLCALEGKSYKEVADILEIPIGTVSSRMTTALKQLREKFQQVVV